VARQAELLVTEIRAKVPAGSLKFPKTDRIQTADCTATGRIMSELKVIPTSRPGASAVKLADPLVFQSSKVTGPDVEAGTEIGKAALQIEGTDLDGKAMTLHEYRGKVVVLIFWGNWCPPCRAMYSQIKALESNRADDPFVVLGVNSDRNRDD